MSDEVTLGPDDIPMESQKSRVKKKKKARGKGKANDKPSLLRVGEEDAVQESLRKASGPSGGDQIVSNPSPNEIVPSYTPLNVTPLGMASRATAIPYVAPHPRPLAFRPAPNSSPNTALLTRHRSTQATIPSKPKLKISDSCKSPETPKSPKSSAYGSIIAQKARPPPQPTPAYSRQASQIPTRLPEPGRLLIVLDLNGTLIHRTKSHRSFTPRPYLDKFLEYCFENHSVMVWSSARPHNVALMCEHLFTPQQRRMLVAEWARDTLGLTKFEYNEKVQVYKRLSMIWENQALQKRSCPGYQQGRRWSQANTILVDDGLEKAVSEPWNLVQVPEFEGLKGGKDRRGDVDDLAEVFAWVEEARQWSDISAFAGAMGMKFEVGKDWTKLARHLGGEESHEGIGDGGKQEEEEDEWEGIISAEEISGEDFSSDDSGDGDGGGVRLPFRGREPASRHS